ncbi:MAG: trypsin-like peptidase domain-containing protein [Anaerolineales bacterium]|nr:trypsin-like peptidase domain-containing protein [Anaerolineales bacterium]
MSWKHVFYALLVILVAGISALSGVVAGGIAVYAAIQDPVQANATDVTPVIQAPVTRAEIEVISIDTAITRAVEQVGPAVVTVVGLIPGQTTFFGRTADAPVSGSGVIISTDGYILTNNHVVEDTVEVSVILADGSEIPAEIVGTDMFSDLAVLKVDQPVPAIARLGNSDALKPGETVIAIGSPLGDFKNTVTVGVVSATGRSLEVSANYQMEGLIQTDAAINQGNSGGPLVNLAGEVIGINTLIVRGNGFGSAVAEGLGFAIPANMVAAVSEQLIDQGYFSYPYLGIRWQWISPEISAMYDLPVEYGAYVSQIVPDSPAEQAGLLDGDIILSLGGVELDAETPFINALYQYAPGETIPLGILRADSEVELQVTLGEHPSP